jgi:hypothetical protein
METGEIVRERYRIVQPLGQGAQGAAYLADDTASGQRVVVKLLRMSEVRGWAEIELFEREARVLRGLNHESIPRYVDSFDAEIGGQHTFALVQQYMDAPSLQKLISSGWRGTEEEIRDIGARLLSVVGYMHALRPPIVHRDINPKNVLRAGDGTVYLVDFGGVQDALRLQATGGNTVIGTPGYVPPEQMLGRATVRSDLYAVAVTLVVLLTHCDPNDLPVRELKVDYRRVVEVSPALAEVLDSYLDPDEARRALPVDRAIALLAGSAPPSVAGGPPAGAGEKPYGSRILVRETPRGRVIVVPEGGLNTAAVVQGGFSAFWLAFVAFWTVSAVAMGAPIFFPLFSIPFWGVGLYLMHRTMNGIFGRSELVLGPTDVTFVKRLFSLSRATTIPLSHVGPCRIERQANAPGAYETACMLEAGALRIRLGASLTDREKEWLCRTVNAHLDAARPRP